MFYPRLVLFLTEASNAVEEVLPEVLPDAPIVEEEVFDFWKYLQGLFTPELIATITSLLTMIVVVFKVVKVVKDLAKKNSGTINDVIKAVTNTIQEGNIENGKKLIAPLLAKVNKVEHTEEIFTKVLALLIQNDEKSRLAIFDLLQSLGTDNQAIEEAKNEVLKQQEEQKAKDEETIAKLESMQVEEQPKEETSVAGRV